MKGLLTVCCLFAIAICIAQEKNVSALWIQSPIKIDGNLEESVWKQASQADSFIANAPHFGKEPSQRTTVRVLYDDQAVYIGAYLYDVPGLVRKQLTSRDGEQRKDVDYFRISYIVLR